MSFCWIQNSCFVLSFCIIRYRILTKNWGDARCLWIVQKRRWPGLCQLITDFFQLYVTARRGMMYNKLWGNNLKNNVFFTKDEFSIEPRYAHKNNTSNWRSFLTSTKWNKHESGLFWNFRPYWMTYRSKKWFSSLALFRNLDWLFPYVFTIERYCTLVIFNKIACKSVILWVFSLR